MASPDSYQRPACGNNARAHWGSSRACISSQQSKQELLRKEDEIFTHRAISSGNCGAYSYRYQRDGGRRSRGISQQRPTVAVAKPQLANIKKQWDVERDIPSGTVRNNPFTPKPLPIATIQPPPQLMHQKKQWDTREIPRGAVAARVLSTEGSTDEVVAPSSGIGGTHVHVSTGTPPARNVKRNSMWGNDPEWASNPQLQSSQPVSPHVLPEGARSPRSKQETLSGTFRSSRCVTVAQNENKTTALRGRLIENPCMTQEKQKQLQTLPTCHAELSSQSSPLGSSRWEPSLEIPKGTVKGRNENLFGALSRSDEGDLLPISRSDPERLHDSTEDEDEDPWIFPSKASVSQQVFPGDWGEAVAAKSSQESDDWENPGKDWFRSAECETSASRPTHGTKVLRRVNAPSEIAREASLTDYRVLSLSSVPNSDHIFSVVEEKKMNDDESVADNRDADVLEMARKKKMNDVQDQNVLPATKRKSLSTPRLSHSTRMSPQGSSLYGNVDEDTAESDFYPNELGETLASFQCASQGHQGHHIRSDGKLSSFQDTREAFGRNSSRNRKVDGASNKKHPQFFCSNDEEMSNIPPPSKEASIVPNSSYTPSLTSCTLQGPENRFVAENSSAEKMYYQTTASDLARKSAKLSPQPNPSKDKSEDDTTISDMTLPTAFKDVQIHGGGVSSKSSRNLLLSSARSEIGTKLFEDPALLKQSGPETSRLVLSPCPEKCDLSVEDNFATSDAQYMPTRRESSLQGHTMPSTMAEKRSGVASSGGPYNSLTYSHPGKAPRAVYQNNTRLIHQGLATNLEVHNSQPTNVMRDIGGKLYRHAVDPFDVNSSVFASGDPFGAALDPNPTCDQSGTAFGDPFFCDAPVAENTVQPENYDLVQRDNHYDSKANELQQECRLQSTSRRLKVPMAQERDAGHGLAEQWVGSFVDQHQVSSKKRRMEKLRKYTQLSSSRQPKQEDAEVLPGSSDATFSTNDVMAKVTIDTVTKNETGGPRACNASAVSTPPRIERTNSLQPFNYVVSISKGDHPEPSHTQKQTQKQPASRFKNRQAKIMHSMAESNRVNKKKRSEGAIREDLNLSTRVHVGDVRGQAIGSLETGKDPVISGLKSTTATNVSNNSHRMKMNFPSGTYSLKPKSTMGNKSSGGCFSDLMVPPKDSPTSASPSTVNDAMTIGGSSFLAQESARSALRKESPIQSANDVSTRSYRSIDSNSSVGSDIRTLRSILRRPRRSPASGLARPTKQTFAAYDEKAITDPMQRAGLRLLSAAIIPIQTEVRKFLSMRRALTRMWALIVIQTYARSWMARRRYLGDIGSIIKVQSLFRALKARSILHYETDCATEIQRYMRGYLATMRVYEEIYKVTIVQSFIRMKLAVDKATHRMAAIIQLQSIARGFLFRREFQSKRAGAIVIQASWRCFVVRLGYQFDLLDIIIAQSVWRRRCGSREASQRRYERWVRSATAIQSQWRSYDCTMNYLHYLADVLVVQSAVRRFLARTYVTNLKESAAVRIQAAARSFINRRSLGEYFSARTIQTRWRGYICYHGAKAYFAARRIQANWRGYVSFRDATGALAARLIQAHWRGYLCYRHVRQVRAATSLQSYWRRFACVKRANAYFSARRIQACWRGHACYRNTTIYFAARVIQSAWRRRACYQRRKEYYASRVIQRFWRGYVCVMDIKEYFAARRIQSAWRSFVCYADFMFTVADIVIVQKLARRWLARRVTTIRRKKLAFNSAKKIQSAWRDFFYARKIQRAWATHLFRTKRENAATSIQKSWRCFVDETEYVVMRYESYAARTIQTYWRRFWCFSNFIIALDCSIQIQAVFRGFRQRRRLYSQHACATSIQSGYRIFLAKQEASRMSMIQALSWASNSIACKHSAAAVLIQRTYKGAKVRYAVKLYQRARTIQRVVRGRQARIAVTLYLGAREFQKLWRGFYPRREYTIFIAARRIQNCWRCKNLFSKYKLHRASVVLQSFWRYKMLSYAYKLYRSALKIQTKFRSVKARQDVLVHKSELLAAILIQSAWRGFVCYTDYIFTIADIVAVQKIVRGFVARCIFSDQIRSRIMERQRQHRSTSLIQKACRGFICRQRYWYALGCAMQIQSWIRGRFVIVRLRRQHNARLLIQSSVRRYLAKQEYLQRRFIYTLIQTGEQEKKKRIAAKRIQVGLRSFLQARKSDRAARVIQRFFLMVKTEVDRMVWAAKRRREWRRRLKNRADNMEDTLLEDAWHSAVCNLDTEPSFHSCTSWNGTSVLHDPGAPQPRNELRKQRRDKNISGRGDFTYHGGGKKLTRKQRLHPRLYSDKPSAIVGVSDDDRSELSGLTASTVANYLRIPQSRVEALSTTEFNEDLELEEAFIDAEIQSAKERRRKADKRIVYPSPTASKRSQGSKSSRRRRVKVSATTN